MSAGLPYEDALHLSTREIEDMTVVAVRGAAGPTADEHLEAELTKLVSAQRPELILDLSELSFINSVALGAIVTAHRACRERGGVLCFVNPLDAVEQVLRITQLDRLVEVFPSVEAAVAALADRSA